MIVDHTDETTSDGVKLRASPRQVEIDYTGLSFVLPDKVRFRYRLSGYEKEWNDVGIRRQAFYSDLPPGRYTFQVTACNNDGVWNANGASLTFFVPPAWYQALWFYVLCAALAIALVSSVYWLRLRQYSAVMALRFNERLEERTRLARDLHDTLLQTIQGMKLAAEHAKDSVLDPSDAKTFATNMADWSERATLEGRAALDSLRTPMLSHGDLAQELRQSFDNYCSGGTMELRVSASGKSREMHPIVHDEIFRIADEAIRNACLHSEGKWIDIELVYTENFQVRIRDDGKGIGSKILETGKAGHYGLMGMRERASRVQGTLTVSSSSEGTEIVLLVPGRISFRDRGLAYQSKRPR